MAKTVDNFSTIENFRQTYNELATDVGTISGLQTPRQGNLVDALNSVNEKDFFFQEFIYVVSSQGTVTFTGNDNVGNLLKFRDDRIQVFVRGEHLIEGIDYVISNQNSDGTYGQITLQGNYADGGSKETEVNDRVIVYSYTGSYLGVAVSSTGSSFFQLSDTNSVYNNNQNGVILNGDSTSITSQLQTGFTLQLAGKTYAEDDITLATGKTLTAPTVTDGTASLSSGSLTSAVNGTFSGTVTGGTLTDGTASITGGAGTGFSSITSTSFTGNLTGTATQAANLNNHDTADLTEGSNLYYTDARVDTRMAGKDINFFDDVNYTSAPSNGQILVWDGANNYWEPADQQTSDSVTEGSNNLYFTNERVDDRVGSLLTAGTGISLSYDDNANTLTITGSAQYGDSDVQSYLSGGAGLSLSGSGSFSVNTSNGVKIDGDDVELDYEVISSSSLGGSAPDGTGDAVGHLYFVI